MHDLSKLSPSEFFPYMNWFSDSVFNGYRKSSGGVRGIYMFTGCGLESVDIMDEVDRRQKDFDLAWNSHIHKNPHHWQHWVLREDSGATKVLEMPEVYVKEMVCDWVGAGIAITGKREVREWYAKNKEKIVLHPETRKFVEQLLLNI
jgi:hypothetical protein